MRLYTFLFENEIQFLDPVDWSWSVALKKKGSGKLRWFSPDTKDEKKALKLAREYAELLTKAQGVPWHDYGFSKHYYHKYPKAKITLTKDEYDKVVKYQQEHPEETKEAQQKYFSEDV